MVFVLDRPVKGLAFCQKLFLHNMLEQLSHYMFSPVHPTRDLPGGQLPVFFEKDKYSIDTVLWNNACEKNNQVLKR